MELKSEEIKNSHQRCLHADTEIAVMTAGDEWLIVHDASEGKTRG